MIDLKTAVHEVRSQILMDLDSSDFRWPDVLMVRSANWVIHEMLRKKPILQFSAPNAYADEDSFLIPEGALDNGGTYEVQFPARYKEAFIHGLAARCLHAETGDETASTRMAYEASRFSELMAQ